MNILGISIGRTKNATPEEEEPLVQTVDANGNPITQAKLFSVRYAAGTARDTLRDIAKNAAAAVLVTKLVMAITMPHQIGYLLSLAPFEWTSLQGIAASATLTLMALLGPLAVDYLTLICIRIVASKSMKLSSKVVTGIVMLLPVGFSGWVNFIAPAPIVLKIMAAFLVSLIPATQIVRAMGNRPDFRRVDKDERSVTDFGNSSEPAPDSITEEERQRRIDRGRKAAETRRTNAAAKAEASQISDEEREIRRQRGLRAAETRRLNAEAAALAAVRKPRTRKTVTKTAAQEVEELESIVRL